MITIRSREDVADVWQELRKPSNKIQLWCDGLIGTKPKASRRKRRRIEQLDSDSDDDCRRSNKQAKNTTAVQEREEKVQESLDALKKKYGASYTQMQYSIWAKCIANGLSTPDNAPTSSMFKCAGGGPVLLPW